MSTIRLEPLGIRFSAPPGTALADHLINVGVEMPCGGRGVCGRCRVRVTVGEAPLLEVERAVLGPATDQGWRLGCRMRSDHDLTLEVGAWEAPVLADTGADHAGTATPATLVGSGIAIDLGTTTIAAQAVDRTGRVVAVASGLNPQTRWGADVVSRMDHALHGGRDALGEAVRIAIGGWCRDLADHLPPRPQRVFIAGNTVMHHLVCGFEIDTLARMPFASANDGVVTLRGADFDWPEVNTITVLPSLGGFVGGDITAGILATGLHRAEKPTLLVDLGTNGEIALGWRGRLWAAATAAGPAFEGAGISCGMRAATGAITHATLHADAPQHNSALRCTVLGGGPARGICGSGLVDVTAAALDQGWLLPNGKLTTPNLPLADGVALLPKDFRALQLAKGAIAAGIDRVCAAAGITVAEVDIIHLAGAFGNYLDPDAAIRIGLLPGPVERLRCAGNTALLGARLALLTGDDLSWMRERCTLVPLDSDPGFIDAYAEAMRFPG